MPISSLIVRTEEGHTAEIGALLATHPAIEVSHVAESAVAIVTETPEDSVDKLLWKQIEGMAGVMHVELIYHNFEDLEVRCHESK